MKIDDKDNVGINIGEYNPFVNSCIVCGELLDRTGKNCIGFGKPDRKAQYIDKNIAIVYECHKCFTRQWSHGYIGDYRRYLGWRSENANVDD